MCVIYKYYNIPTFSFRPYQNFLRFMHIIPQWIRATFMYLSHQSPKWSEKERLAGICCDELYIDTSTEIDLVLDMPLNVQHAKNAHIFMVRSLCGKWKFPFFADIDHTFTKEEVYEAILRFETANITVLSVTADQGSKNLGLFRDLGITPDQVFFPHPNDPDKKVYCMYDIIHLCKTIR